MKCSICTQAQKKSAHVPTWDVSVTENAVNASNITAQNDSFQPAIFLQKKKRRMIEVSNSIINAKRDNKKTNKKWRIMNDGTFIQKRHINS